MLKELILAIRAYFTAHRFILQHKLWKWILLPGLFYALFFIYGFSFFWSSSNEAIEWILVESHAKNWLEKMEDSWLSFFFIIGKIFLRLLLLIFYLSLFKFLFFIRGSLRNLRLNPFHFTLSYFLAIGCIRNGRSE